MLSINEPAVQSFAVYSSILGVKMLSMALLTGRQRFRKGVFANEEDVLRKGSKVKLDDPDVERVRRAHLNDLENIPVFWVLGALYLTTDPDPETAIWLFRAFTLGRVAHTIVYAIKPTRQPARGIAFWVGNLVNLYMGYKVITQFSGAL